MMPCKDKLLCCCADMLHACPQAALVPSTQSGSLEFLEQLGFATTASVTAKALKQQARFKVLCTATHLITTESRRRLLAIAVPVLRQSSQHTCSDPMKMCAVCLLHNSSCTGL